MTDTRTRDLARAARACPVCRRDFPDEEGQRQHLTDAHPANIDDSMRAAGFYRDALTGAWLDMFESRDSP